MPTCANLLSLVCLLVVVEAASAYTSEKRSSGAEEAACDIASNTKEAQEDEIFLLQTRVEIQAHSIGVRRSEDDSSHARYERASRQRERHCPNPAHLRYELLRDFVQYMARKPDLRWTLGGGSLLGAMRQKPPGFIQHDDDLDIYMPARDLFLLHDSMTLCNSSMLGVIEPASTDSCCGFGWRVMHRDNDCAYMDFFALALEPFFTWFENVGDLAQWFDAGLKVWVMPQDTHPDDERADAMMTQRAQWLQKNGSEWRWNGRHKTLFCRSYILEDEYLPLQQMLMYNLSVNIPKSPWAILHREYGSDCGSFDDKGHDMKDPRWSKPADVQALIQVASTGAADPNNATAMQDYADRSKATGSLMLPSGAVLEENPFRLTLSTGALIPVLCVAVWLSWTSMCSDGLMLLKLTLSEWMYVFLFVSLSAASTLALRQTNGSKVQMTIEACVLLYALKAAVSLGLLVFKQSMSLAAISEGLSQKDGNTGVPVWGYLALTGSLFAAYDALSFGATQHMAPLSFQLLLNSRTLLLVPLQYGVFGKKVTPRQFCALLIMGIGICALASGDMKSLNTVAHDKDRHDYIVAVVMILGKVIVSAVALIVNEKTLKEMPLTVDAQNCIMYCFGMLPLGVGVLVMSLTEMEHQGMAATLREIFSSSWMLLAVACMTSLGIVCAYLLKAFSAMEKEIMSGGVVALLAIGQWLTPGEVKLTLLSLECSPIIVAGCLAYRLNEPVVATK